MNKITTWAFRLALIVITLGSIFSLLLRNDDLKFSAFANACSGATEKLYLHQPFSEFAIEYKPWVGVIEDDYYPSHLAREILKRNGAIKKIQLLYEAPRDKVADASCVGMYAIEAKEPDEIEIAPCGKMLPASSIAKSNIVVKYEYGSKNLFDVRPFTVSVVNTQTGEILAQQHSFQLLLGNMSNPKIECCTAGAHLKARESAS
ncbi:hypothetical protein EON83_30565 [bacterium]|nr:MAG: hypothetical protein EON83_30565 [bacterium]